MHYLITGGTGFIGSVLIPTLINNGHSVTVLSRQIKSNSEQLRFVQRLDDLEDDEVLDGVINLAGASLAGKRWSRAYKQEIIDSRLSTTVALYQLISRLKHPPQVMLSASAIGFYGHQGDERLSEDAEVSPGFSQDLCQRWETAALSCASLGVRVCLLRLGVVLDKDGGAFTEMARPFQLGVANWMGSGRQWLSWVHREDAVAAMLFLLERTDLEGAFNITAPEPVTSRGFCNGMKKHMRTFVTAPMPGIAMRLLVGEMADELLLNGQRVVPSRLLAAGFEFTRPALDDALSAIHQT
ncbi:MAG: TIGR01777 family oxidoreductase [Pseudomonadota bacterium]